MCLFCFLVTSAAQGSSFFGGGSERAAHGPQGYLGINFKDVGEEQVAALKLKEAHGEEVILVDHDGPASKAGIREHDVLVQMNGQNIEGEEHLRRMLRETPAGRRVVFIISREGQQQTISIQAANRDTVGQEAWDHHMTVPEPSRENGAMSHGTGFLGGNAPTTADLPRHGLTGSTILSASYTGAKLEPMGPQLAEFFGAQTGLLVRDVEPDSPAGAAGMRAGDVVIKINAMPVVSSADWLKTVHENRGKSLSVVVLRDKKEQILTLTPDTHKRSSIVFPLAPAVGLVSPPNFMQ